MPVLALNFNPVDPLGSLSSWIVDGAIEAWRQACSAALDMGNVSQTMWQTTFDIVNRVAGIMGFIAVGVGAVAIVQESFKGSLGGVVSAVFRTILAWPITVILINVTVCALSVESAVTTRILSFAFGDTGKIDITLEPQGLTSINLSFALFIALLLILGSLVLILVMIARSFLIMLGVALAPIVAMSNAWGMLRPTLNKWGSWMVGVILFKPIAAIILYITSALLKNSHGDIVDFYTAVVGMILACVFPWTIIRIISQFMPGSTGLNTVASAGQSTVDTTKQVVQTGAALATGAVTGLAGGVEGAGTFVGSIKDSLSNSSTQSLPTADTANSKTDTDNKTSMSAQSAGSKDSPSQSSSSAEKTNEANTHQATGNGLRAGVGAFMTSISGVLRNASTSGFAADNNAGALRSASQVAQTIAQISTTGSVPSHSETNNPAITVVANTPPANTQTMVQAAPVATPTPAGEQNSHMDVDVHVNTNVDTSGTVRIDSDK